MIMYIEFFIFISPYIEGIVLIRMSNNHPYIKFGEPTSMMKPTTSMMNAFVNRFTRKDRASQYAVLPDLNKGLETATVTDFKTTLIDIISKKGIKGVILNDEVFEEVLKEIKGKGIFVEYFKTLKGKRRSFTTYKMDKSSWRMEKRVLLIDILILSVIESTILQESTIDNPGLINQKLKDLLDYFEKSSYEAILPINIFNKESLSLIFDTLYEKLQQEISIRMAGDKEALLTDDMRIILIELDNINEEIKKDNFAKVFNTLLDDLHALLLSKKIKLSDLKKILKPSDYDSRYPNSYLKKLIEGRVITPYDVREVKNFFKNRYLKGFLTNKIITYTDLPKLLSRDNLILLIPKLKLKPDSIELKEIVLNLELDDLLDLELSGKLSPVALKQILEDTGRLEKLRLEKLTIDDYIELIKIRALQGGDVKEILKKTGRIYGLSIGNYIKLIQIGALQQGDVPSHLQNKLKNELQEMELESEQSSSGGRKAMPSSIKKVVCGKLRCIYKIHGSRKEHLKYKGRLITVAEYKRLMKA